MPTGTMPEAVRAPGCQQPVDDLLDRAVAADRHEPVVAARGRPRRQLLRVAATARHVKVRIGAKREPLADPRKELRRAPRPRRSG